MSTATPQPDGIAAVLALAARGWRLFPCRRQDKTPLVREWQHLATTDPEQIRAWFTQFPACNWGIATGKQSNLFSIDGDSKPCPTCPPQEQRKPAKDGKAILRQLIRKHSISTLIMLTHHGAQLLFRYPEGMEIRNEQDGHTFGDGVDIRGAGGYIMAPGGVHPEGTIYRFHNPQVQLSPAPASLLAVLAQQRKGEETGKAQPEGCVPEGRRHNHLLSLIGTMLRRKMSLVAIEAAAQAENTARCNPPCPANKVTELVQDAVKRYGRNEATGSYVEGFTLTPLSELLAKDDTPVEYIWEGHLVAGTVSAAVAKPKVGKSTFARNLCLAVARGEDFLGSPTQQGDCIYLALEERENEVRGDFAALGADGTEPIHVHAAPTPAEGMLALVELVRERKPRLVVIDPLFRLARVKDESAYAETYAALGPLIDVARETGTHLMLLHHSGKGLKADPIDAPLGSTALAGAVCTLVVLKRTESYRTIQTVQRVGEDMAETVLEFDGDTKRLSLGAAKTEVDIRLIEAGILDYLQTAGDTKTEPEIAEHVEGKTGLKRKALRALVEQGKLIRGGTGKKGDPFTYKCSFPCSQDIAGTREQESEKPDQTHINTGAILVPDNSEPPILVPEREKGEL